MLCRVVAWAIVRPARARRFLNHRVHYPSKVCCDRVRHFPVKPTYLQHSWRRRQGHNLLVLLHPDSPPRLPLPLVVRTPPWSVFWRELSVQSRRSPLQEKSIFPIPHRKKDFQGCRPDHAANCVVFSLVWATNLGAFWSRSLRWASFRTEERWSCLSQQAIGTRVWSGGPQGSGLGIQVLVSILSWQLCPRFTTLLLYNNYFLIFC